MKTALLTLVPAGAGRLGRCLALVGLGAGGACAQTPNPPLAATTTVTLTVPAALATSPFNVAHSVRVPAGSTLAVYARVSGARFMAITPDGNLLVSQPSTGTVALVRPGSAGATPVVTTFVSGLNSPHDMAFHTIGGVTYLYLSESTQINRYVYHTGDLTGQNRQVIITGLPGGGNHPLKNLALDSNNKLYVAIASSCNACASDTLSNPMRAAIYQYDADGTNRRLFARGLRNAEGLAFVPGTNTLWVAVNNRDNTPYPFNDATGNYGKVYAAYVDNHPPDEFTKVRDGGNYGWPFFNPNPDTSTGMDNMPFDLDYEWNRTGTVSLARMDRISKGIHAHSAALGLTFLQGTAFQPAYANGAVIALHGSWNSTVPQGYKVIYFPWNTATQMPGAEADLVTGFVDLNSGAVWGRPVDTAVDPQGNLLISDDQSGTIYKLSSPIAPLAVTAAAAPAAGAQLYPNPVGTGPATLDLTALPAGPYTVTVFDLLGRPVQPAAQYSGGTRAELALGLLSRGSYLVRLRGEQFSQVLRLVRN